ncbi:MAG: ammonium transporter [Gammaproteobacteria bacterium]|nr:ammonium transporter [Gammaproteobacteria bacterium]
MLRHSMHRLAVLLVGLCASGAALADAPAASNAADTAWLLTATALVLFMTLPGLALFYAGLVRGKNALSILIQCFAISAVVSLLWVAVGYGLAFGDGGAAHGLIGGLDKLWLRGVLRDSVTGSVPETVFLMFQMTFAIITPALIIGGFAERIRFSVVLWFAALWLLLVYVPVAHWVWGGGWLARLGVMDFAGGIVVHINAGVGALVCALTIGRRRGFPQVSMPPHSLPLTAAGAGMLWVGWYGFNAGSALAANGSAGMALLCTHLGAAAGALAWMTLEWWRYGKPSTLGILTGVVAGLGTITPASGFIAPWAALVIGALAGTICFAATQVLKRRLRIDDSLDVSPVHGVGGVIGTLLTGVFAAGALGGAGYALPRGMLAQVGVQAVGILAAAAWCALITWIVLRVLGALPGGLRVSEEEETEGLDVALHGERGYAD